MVGPELLRKTPSTAFGHQLETVPTSCPRLRVRAGLLSINAEVALGYLELGHRPIPLIQEREGQRTRTVPWKAYETEQFPQALRPQRPFPPASDTSQHSNLCETLCEVLERHIRPGTTITCFCHQARAPSNGIHPDQAYCFSQKKRFQPSQVLGRLELGDSSRIDGVQAVYEQMWRRDGSEALPLITAVLWTNRSALPKN